MAENLDIKGSSSGQDPRIVLEEIVNEIRQNNNFTRREAIFLLLDELLREQLAEIN
jgi:hypothetical protein